MFNWGYAVIYSILGLFTAALHEAKNSEVGSVPKWTHDMKDFAPILLIIAVGCILYTGFTFGILWGGLTAAEMFLGAGVWHMLRSNA